MSDVAVIADSEAAIRRDRSLDIRAFHECYPKFDGPVDVDDGRPPFLRLKGTDARLFRHVHIQYIGVVGGAVRRGCSHPPISSIQRLLRLRPTTSTRRLL